MPLWRLPSQRRFLISAEELKRAQAEISEDELESVAGGLGWMGRVRAATGSLL